MTRWDCDLAIIGSGFGGSVCALRAAQAGLRTVVLERGRRMDDAGFAALAEGRTPLMHSAHRVGLAEIPRVSGLICLTGCAVGGGSQLYTAVTIRAPEEIYTQAWPAGLSAETMAPYFDRVEETIRPSALPITLPRTRALEEAGLALGAHVTRLPLAMSWPDDEREMLAGHGKETGARQRFADWLRGGRSTRKRTLDRTYLEQATRAGAEIRPLHEAISILSKPEGYCVQYRVRNDDGDSHGSISARRVVLSAGSLGTLRLLFHCRDELHSLPRISASLGRRFFTNGDLGAVLIHPRGGGDADGGPPVTAWIDLWSSDRLYLMEIGRAPLPPITDYALAWLRPLNRLGDKGYWMIGVMGFDDTPYTISRRPGGALACRRDRPKVSAFTLRAMTRLRELADVSRARLLAPPRLVLNRCAITVHPLGGAAMADSPDSGVTNSFGEVFGCPGLFIADGSLLPTPIGRAPSMTIAALAERVAEHLVSRG